MNQINNMMLDLMASLSQTSKFAAAPNPSPEAEPNRFESLLKEKHGEAAGKNVQTGQTEEAEAPEEQKIPDEQYVLAAALVVMPQPQIVYLTPEQTREQLPGTAPETVPLAAGELMPEAAAAPVQTGAAARTEQTMQAGVSDPTMMETAIGNSEVLPGREAETSVQEPEFATEAKDARRTVEVVPEQKAETLAGEAVEVPREQVQPRRAAREDGGEPGYEAETSEAEFKPQSREKENELAAAGMNWNEPVFEKIEAVPVKVAEAPVPLEEPQAAERLGKELLDAVTDGREQIQIRLAPEGLGELNVTIAKAENGALSVVFRASTNKAANLLEMHSDNLRYMMAANMKTDVQVEVRQLEPQQQYQQPYQQPNDGREQQGRQQQPQQEQRRGRQDTQDFLQKLRLGLTELSQVV